MEGHETAPKITIKAASNLLGVTTKTIHRYLAKGHLTRIKEGTRTLLLLAEVKAMSSAQNPGQGQASKTAKRPAGTGHIGDTVTLGRERYEQLLLELGELRKQNQFFLEFKGMMQAKEEAMRRVERDVEELLTRMHTLEMRTREENLLRASEESQEATSSREKTRSRPKKPWWQA